VFFASESATETPPSEPLPAMNSSAFVVDTLPQVRHALPKVPVPVVDPHRVLYGIETCGRKPYEEMVRAELETWGSELPRESLLVVGGSQDDFLQGYDTDENPCPDRSDGMACKEGLLLYRAIRRAQRLNSSWLVVGQDDKYISPGGFERYLEQYDPWKSQVMGILGCGKHTEQRQPPYSCEGVVKNGGICGGPTYVVSRAALDRLSGVGTNVTSFLADFLGSAVTHKGKSDIYASCFFYLRGVPVTQLRKLGTREIHKLSSATALENHIRDNAKQILKEVAFHVRVGKDIVPSGIRWLHELFLNSSLPPPT